MVVGYTYELWDGKKVVGTVTLHRPLLMGHAVDFPVYSTFKQRYNGPYKTIRVPIVYRTVEDNGIDIVLRKVLDVKRKSKEQIALIMKNRGMF